MGRVALDRYCPTGPKVRSVDAVRFHVLPERSVIPELSVTRTLYWTPGTVPAATVCGLPVIVTVSVSFVCVVVLETQFAFVPQTTSATVSVLPPVQPEVPWVGVPAPVGLGH